MVGKYTEKETVTKELLDGRIFAILLENYPSCWYIKDIQCCSP